MVIQMRIKKTRLSTKELDALANEAQERTSLIREAAEAVNKVTYGISEESYVLNNDCRVSYGIVIYANADQDGTAMIIDSIRDISSDKEKIALLVDECNRHKLSPIHLRDVIDDFIG